MPESDTASPLAAICSAVVIGEITGGGCVTWMRSGALAAGSGARIGHRFTAGGGIGEFFSRFRGRGA